MQIRNIVVGVGSINDQDPVLTHAIELARALGARLHVVHGFLVVDPLLDAYTQAGYLGEAATRDLQPEYERTLRRYVEEAGGGDLAQVHVTPGTPAMALLDAAEEERADLLVVGATTHDRFPLSLLGSTARTVVRQSHRPVLMMRTDRPPLPARILLATDLSPSSARAIEIAMKIGKVGAAELRALLVIDEALRSLSLKQDLLGTVAEDQLAAFLGRFGTGAAIERITREGRPAETILEHAEEWGADLIALGTHGRTGFERFLVGSVAESVLGSAGCHVLITPQAEDGEEANG